ncbi:pyrroloquinoline quinone biosynthesis protein PqqB [Variovorax sp. Varisp41]|jgi:pyrroloquinoline quinone biosynthesis protein B|uniref:pyrroloquinoline quinone biosynthesis protein PqqB n=1 Tax=unclassified Variovorax TaxID=663243 RepID=UPI0021BADE6D|nr:pyrroloquinoline quinone biosynthesis protein PqqB [Variovorax sp. CY25R-8]MCT8176930.1 pyrroloquinoline quinone biosynthesis protein PqqB [Variovorax sp. CY25R-8]
MHIRVLGAAAGGGFPQWNCNCANCAGLRAGTVRARARTQSSICAKGDTGDDWVLVNASPDILEQIKATPALQPGRGPRDTGIAGVVLVDGQVDHSTGLYMLRERGAPLPLWCTGPVYEDLTQGNPILRVLSHFCGVAHHELPLDGRGFEVPGVSGLALRALALVGKAAPYSPHREHPVPGDNIGLTLTDTASGRSAFYAPGLGAHSPEVDAAMRAADCVMVDGTFWRDDEMIALGFSRKTGRSIGHLPQSGPGGMLEWLADLPARTRKVLIHINNTNPILDEDSPERAELDRRGIEVAFDGMEVVL